MHDQPRKPSLEESLNTFIQASTQIQEANNRRFDSLEASVKKVETQVGQLAHQLQVQQKGKLPSQVEQVKSIVVINGDEDQDKEDYVCESTINEGKKEQVSVQTQERSAEAQDENPHLQDKHREREAFPSQFFHKAANPYRPPIPFPSRLRNHECIKEPSTKKKEFGLQEKVTISEVASAILQQLPPKSKDPGSFVLDIALNDIMKAKGMLDLGSSINLMPYTCYLQLGLGKLKPTKMSLELANGSICYPKGIIEDVIVHVGGLFVLVDFVVLDTGRFHSKGKECTILLGRSFMATTNTLIDVKNGCLTMTVLDETISLSIFDTIHTSPTSSTIASNPCLSVGVVFDASPMHTLREKKVVESILLDDP